MSPYDKEELEATKDEADVNAQNKSDDEMAPPNAVSKEQGSVTGGFKLLLLALMVVQNSSTVLVGRYTRSSVPKDDLFNVNHLVLIAELAKVRVHSPDTQYGTRSFLHDTGVRRIHTPKLTD